MSTLGNAAHVRMQRFNHFAIKATCAYSKVVKALCSHKNQFGDRGEPNDPGLGCATSARLPNMRPVAGTRHYAQLMSW
jgi:hypothetical protein